ncbi:hypothetical protein SY83_05655 [Paenibacillus swuensis]|uniref:DUF2651 domain-containing protein n=1 Tax=Paenibacillus swuensis TaxID=1178515 RepID=A0A172TG15_9BACL|nr:hypothetical protein SY83_05655 [Paenibacillus swuensis]
MINVLTQILIIYPVIILLLSIVGYLLLKNAYIVPLLVFIFSVVIMYQFYNTTFLVWVFVYTLLSLIISVVSKRLYSLYKATYQI